MSIKSFLRPLTDDLLRISGLKNIDDTPSTFVNNATVTAVVKDSAGDVVAGADSITLSYEAASDGVYKGLVPDTAAIVDADEYTLVITIVASVVLCVLGLIPVLDGEEGVAGRWVAWRHWASVVCWSVVFGTISAVLSVAIPVRFGWLRNWFPDINQLAIIIFNPGSLLTLAYMIWSLLIMQRWR